jgi:hypothetical protein
VIGCDELAELEAFEAVYNLPDIFFLVGTLAPLFYNGLLATRRRPGRPEDFVPIYQREKMTVADMAEFFRTAAARGAAVPESAASEDPSWP